MCAPGCMSFVHNTTKFMFQKPELCAVVSETSHLRRRCILKHAWFCVVDLGAPRSLKYMSLKKGGGHGAGERPLGQLPWREAGPPNRHDDEVDSDQQVVNKELSLSNNRSASPDVVANLEKLIT